MRNLKSKHLNPKIKIGVIHFTKCTDTTTIASARIAKFIQRELRLYLNKNRVDLIDSTETAYYNLDVTYDILFIVNSSFGFCDWRDECLQICEKAGMILWVQNDYALKPPSQFKKHGIEIDMTISTCEGWNHYYLDWNRLTYDGNLSKVLKAKDSKNLHNLQGLFYYGAYRKDRKSSFQKYFYTKKYPVYISSTKNSLNKFQYPEWSNKHPIPILHDPIKTFLPFQYLSQIASFQTSIYIEDNKNHGQNFSLANRFYELLSAGISILVDKNCKHIFEENGLPLNKSFIVDGDEDVEKCVKDYYIGIKLFQEKNWVRNYYQDLRMDFKKFIKEVL